MNKKLVGLVFLAMFSANILTACGDEDVEVPATVDATQQTNTTTQQQSSTTTTTQSNTTTSSTNKTTTTTPAKTTTSTGKTTTTTTPAKTTTSTSTSSSTSNLSVAQKIILKTQQTYDSFTNYTSNLSFFTKRNDKTSPTATATATAKFKLTYEKATQRYLLTVIEHSISVAVGARLVWKAGDKTAKAKAAGALGLVTLDLDLGDAKLTTNRNWRLDQLDPNSILARAAAKDATLNLVGKSTINGKDAYMVQIKGKGLDDEVTEENVAIDVKDFVILADEMYAGTTLVYQLKGTMESTNASLAADTFNL